MNCYRAHQSISPYLDHELTGAEMLEIQKHLEGCRACAQEYRSARHIKELLRSLRVQEPSGPLDMRIAHRLALAEAPMVWQFPLAARPLTAALALSCIALFAITPSFAPPVADSAAPRPLPVAFRSQAAFVAETPAEALRTSPAALSLLLAQPSPNPAVWQVTPTVTQSDDPDAPPPLAELGAEPLGDPAADGYIALANYRTP
ncbi:MAG: zf-HC2 domain-containing protein [Armatimonadota bacterium]|nr:zf-HC2 domain-containing protein [Armatimonadota bacterium]